MNGSLGWVRNYEQTTESVLLMLVRKIIWFQIYEMIRVLKEWLADVGQGQGLTVFSRPTQYNFNYTNNT